MKNQNQVITLDQMNITQKSDSCVALTYQDEFGSLSIERFRIFPGIEVIFKNFHRSNTLRRIEAPPADVFIIEHCRKGRVECRLDDFYFYLTAGDVTVRRPTPGSHIVGFPEAHYQGIDILIDPIKFPKTWNHILEDVYVDPKQLLQKFRLNDHNVHFLRQNKRLEYIFADLYDIPESIRTEYIKIKIFEIMLFMTGMELDAHDATRKLPLKQVQLAKDAHVFIADNMNKHVTIAQLAKHFGTSQTYLKDSFRKVYGTMVQGFILEQKMHAAARALDDPNRKITEISSEFGYANASKFSTAFRRVIGMSPAQYRISRVNTE